MTEYAEVVKRVPLYRSIPETERVTVEEAEAYWRERDPDYPLTDYQQQVLERIRHPQCECAVIGSGGKANFMRMPLSRKWVPCQQPVIPGEVRCRQHGGPAVKPERRQSYDALKAERDRLAARLAELEADP